MRFESLSHITDWSIKLERSGRKLLDDFIHHRETFLPNGCRYVAGL